jgi:hypothetical protein
MIDFETQLCMQLAKESLVVADRTRNPELKSAVLGVAMRYASMAEMAANRHAMSPAKGWSSYTAKTK